MKDKSLNKWSKSGKFYIDLTKNKVKKNGKFVVWWIKNAAARMV